MVKVNGITYIIYTHTEYETNQYINGISNGQYFIMSHA